MESFKEDVSSDFGSGESFIHIGLGTPSTPQYLVIDTGSDIVPNQKCYNNAQSQKVLQKHPP